MATPSARQILTAIGLLTVAATIFIIIFTATNQVAGKDKNKKKNTNIDAEYVDGVDDGLFYSTSSGEEDGESEAVNERILRTEEEIAAKIDEIVKR